MYIYAQHPLTPSSDVPQQYIGRLSQCPYFLDPLRNVIGRNDLSENVKIAFNCTLICMPFREPIKCSYSYVLTARIANTVQLQQ